MKPFNSVLGHELQEYLTYRKDLGYTDKTLKSHLMVFDQYVVDHDSDWSDFEPCYFLTLRESLNGKPRTVNETMRSVRGFFQFLVRQSICEQNPLEDIPAYPEGAYIPFIFSPQTTEQLLCAIEKSRHKTPPCFFTDLAVYLGILFMARCGLRISEPVGLLCNHYREREGTIYIEKTKFKKDRLIPIPKLLVSHMNHYLAIRKSFAINNPYLLADSNKRISAKQLRCVFDKGVKNIGLNQSKRTIANTTFGAPTPHSLRHSFAVNTLKRIKDQGKSPQDALPVLAAYMGHGKYRYTSVYLKVLDAQKRQGLVDFSISRQEEV